MKKMLALMIALMMALSCFGAVAEELAIPEIPSFTATASVTVDQEQLLSVLPMFGISESDLGMVKMVLPIVSNLGIRAAVADGAQIDVLLKGAEMASIACAPTEEGLILVSDVLPSYVITVSNETIQQLVEQMTSQAQNLMENVDMEALSNAVMGHIGTFLAEAQEALTVGEPELGEYEFEGIAFNVKVPVTVNVKALAKAIVNTIKNLAQDENVLAVLQSAAQLSGQEIDLSQIDLSQLDETAAQIEQTADEEAPALTADLYSQINEDGTAANGNVYIAAVLDTKTEDAGVITASVLAADMNVKAVADIPAQEINVELAGVLGDGQFAGYIEVNAMGMYIGLEANGSFGEEGLHIEETTYFMSKTPLVTEALDVVPGGELTLGFDTEGKTVVTVEEIMADEEGNLLNGLMMDAMSNGLNGLLAKAAEVMPEEVTALVNLFMGTGEEAITE